MNDVLRDVATRHPELTIVDWNLYSRSHPDWFQDDGLHLGYDGAVAMATLIHATLVKPASSGAAARARDHDAELSRRRGWGGHISPGSSLQAVRGRSGGRGCRRAPRGPAASPRRAGHRHATVAGTTMSIVRVTDATGRSAARRLAVVVRAA